MRINSVKITFLSTLIFLNNLHTFLMNVELWPALFLLPLYCNGTCQIRFNTLIREVKNFHCLSHVIHVGKLVCLACVMNNYGAIRLLLPNYYLE